MEDSKVRVLLEDIDHKFDAIWEVVADNPKRFERLETDVAAIKEDISVIKAVLKCKADVSEIDKINKKINILQTKIAH